MKKKNNKGCKRLPEKSSYLESKKEFESQVRPFETKQHNAYPRCKKKEEIFRTLKKCDAVQNIQKQHNKTECKK